MQARAQGEVGIGIVCLDNSPQNHSRCWECCTTDALANGHAFPVTGSVVWASTYHAWLSKLFILEDMPSSMPAPSDVGKLHM